MTFLVAFCGVFFVSVRGLVQSSFLCSPGQRFIVAIYPCALTCGRSFSVRSVRGVLIRVLEFF